MKSNDGIETEYLARLQKLESRIEKLENAPCSCLNGINERIANIEKSTKENHLLMQ